MTSDREQPMPLPETTDADECMWTFTDSEFWETDCGKSFTVNDGTPAQNGMRFCCYCGNTLIEVVGQNEDA